MQPTTQYALLALIFAVTALVFFAVSIWCARKALRMAKAAAFWQQEAGRNAEDAGKYRIGRAARLKNDAARAQPQAAIKAQTTARLAEGS